MHGGVGPLEQIVQMCERAGFHRNGARHALDMVDDRLAEAIELSCMTSKRKAMGDVRVQDSLSRASTNPDEQRFSALPGAAARAHASLAAGKLAPPSADSLEYPWLFPEELVASGVVDWTAEVDAGRADHRRANGPGLPR